MGQNAHQRAKIRLQKGESSLNYTEHYQLNQWEPTDRVLREDFNEDNRKIEAALQQVNNSNFYVEIAKTTLSKPAKEIKLDVSSINFLQYCKIELFVSCPEEENGFTLQVNNWNSGYTYTEISGGGAGDLRYTNYLASFPSRSQGILSFYPPAYNSTIGCFYSYSAGGAYTGYQVLAPCTWEELKILHLTSAQQFAANTCVKLIGMKK